MNKSIIDFSLKLLFLLGFIFAIHLFTLSKLNTPLFENKIIAAYTANYIVALIIYIALFKLKKKYLDILGFIFMGGSLLKFIVYFIFFYPSYRENGTINSLEAIAFLIPYIASLFFETFYLIKLLNNRT